jgi:hypothetical protein
MAGPFQSKALLFKTAINSLANFFKCPCQWQQIVESCQKATSNSRRSSQLFNALSIIFTLNTRAMKYATAVLLLLLNLFAAAQGHEIKVTLKPFKNQYIYLGHYYGRQLPIIDSVKLNDRSEGVFKGPNKLGGGIYLIGYPDRSRHFEVLIDKTQNFSISADTADISKIVYTGSPENTAFATYQAFMASAAKP